MLSALRFILANTALPAPDTPGEPVELRGPDGFACAADLYAPAGRSAGLILFVHGMSAAGRRDPRMCRASRALTAAGFHVLTPDVPDLRELRVGLDTPDHLERCIRAAQARWTPHGQLGLFAVSYSAAVSLLALARPGAGGLVSAACALGTFSNAVRWARFLLSEPGSDEYARLLVFLNFIGEVADAGPGVYEGLRLSIDDLWHKRDPGGFPALLATLPDADRALLRALREDPAEWMRLGAALVGQVGPRLEPLDVCAVADRITTPVVLIHGARDLVIPAEESRYLHEALTRAGRESQLVLTPLLDHGDAAIGPRELAQAPALIGAFAAFFRRVRAGTPAGWAPP